jgi:hypothetical protein
MKRTSYFTCLKYLFLRKSTEAFQEIVVRNFIPGCYRNLSNEALEIRRLSEATDLYEVTQITGDHRESWTGFYEDSSRQIVCLQRSAYLAFIPEQKKLLFASKEFIKQY